MIKIMVTLGSESIKERNLKKLSKKTKIFRFNGSHGDLNWHKNSINFVRKSILDPLIVMDIPGRQRMLYAQGTSFLNPGPTL